MSLPRTFDDIKISINEWTEAYNLNSKLSNIYDNFEFLEDSTFRLENPIDPDSGISSRIKNETDDLYHSREVCLVKRDEYIDAWVYNRCFRLLIENHFTLKNSLYGRYLNSEDDEWRYLKTEELQPITTTPDYYIGCNELVSSIVLNRCLERLYRVQETIYNIVKPIS